MGEVARAASPSLSRLTSGKRPPRLTRTYDNTEPTEVD